MDGCPFRFAFKSGFNLSAEVLTAMKSNISSAANCLLITDYFKPLILPVFTTVASRLNWEQKGKEKYILIPNATWFKLIDP